MQKIIQAHTAAEFALNVFNEHRATKMMAYTYQMLAIIYSYNNENIKSESIYKKLIALTKKEQMYDILEDSYNNLLWLYYRKKDTQNFINCLQALKKEKGINIDAQTLVIILLFCYYHSLDDEFDFWKSSFHKNIHDKELFNKMAEAAIYAKSNNFDAAIANLQDCLKLADSYENEEITLSNTSRNSRLLVSEMKAR